MTYKKQIQQLRKRFILQKDQSDCGVVCLQNVIRYHGGEVSLEKLRELSGTDRQGTTLLGLYQCARQTGFDAQGVEADGLENLKAVRQPCILHLTMDNRLMHYVVYYPMALKKGKKDARKNQQALLIGDPAAGVVEYTAGQLAKLWQTRTCLLLTPNGRFRKLKSVRQDKWHWFRNMLKEDVELLWLAAFLGTIMAVLNLSTALFSQQLLDKIVPHAEYTRLILGVVLLTLLLIAKSAIGYIRSFLLIRQAYQFNIRLTGGFYKSLLYLKKAFFDSRKTGDLIARLDDTLRIQRAVSYMLGDISVQVLLWIVSIIFIFIFSWPLGLTALLIVPVVYGIVKKYEKEILRRQRKVMVMHATNESNYVDTMKGIGSIKAMNKEPLFTAWGIRVFTGFQEAIFQLGKTKMRFNLAAECVGVFFLTGIILWSSLMVLHHDLSMGAMIAILQMAATVMQATAAISLTNIQLQEAKVAFDRMFEFSSAEPEYAVFEGGDVRRTGPAGYEFESLKTENLYFRFPGRKALLKNISFSVSRNEIVAITGESGQGKSTLFQILQKMYTIEQGVIQVNGQPFDQIDIMAWRSLIGVVPQDIMLFSGTLLDNILLEDRPEQTPRVVEFCQQYGLHHFFNRFPQQYATLLGEGGINLSGGQKQLVALARCLYRHPQLLLLDEPTAAMDKQTEQFVLNVLKREKADKAILVISHHDSIADIADRTYHLEGGTICEMRRDTLSASQNIS